MHKGGSYDTCREWMPFLHFPIMHLLRALLAATVAVAGAIAATAPTAAADPATDGLRFESHASFRLEPENRAVRVAMDITLTHERPSERQLAFFLNEINIPVPADATDIAAERVGGDSLQVSVDQTESPSVSGGDGEPRPESGLRTDSGDPAHLRPSGPSAAIVGATRANEALASFMVLTIRSPGRASVELTIPDDYDVVTSGDFTVDVTDDAYVFSARHILNPSAWWAVVVARNDDLLHERTLSVDDHELVVRYWPGDEERADFVEKYVAEGIPILKELVGRP